MEGSLQFEIRNAPMMPTLLRMMRKLLESTAATIRVTQSHPGSCAKERSMFPKSTDGGRHRSTIEQTMKRKNWNRFWITWQSPCRIWGASQVHRLWDAYVDTRACERLSWHFVWYAELARVKSFERQKSLTRTRSQRLRGISVVHARFDKQHPIEPNTTQSRRNIIELVTSGLWDSLWAFGRFLALSKR